MPPQPENGLITIESQHSVDGTVTNLQKLLDEKGIKLFAVIDHSGEAAKAGLEMPNTKLLIFGNPKAGTPLMQSAPTIAIDLPLKILVWETKEGKAQISYNSPEYLANRHGLSADLMQPLNGAASLANQLDTKHN